MQQNIIPSKTGIINICLLICISVYAIDVCSFVALLLNISINDKHFSNIFSSYIALFLLLVVLLRFLPLKIFKILLILVFLPLTLANAFVVGHLLYYHAPIAPMAIQTILDSNPNETLEFIQTMFSYKTIILLMILAVPFVCIYFLKKVYIKNVWVHLLFVVIVAVILVFTVGKRWVKREIAYLYLYDTYLQTKRDKDAFLKLLAVRDGNVADYGTITNNLNDNASQTFVVVIGESHTRQNSSLYGYERDTMPKLGELSDELYIFQDVITPYVHTSPVLQKVLTFSSIDEGFDISAYLLKNIIDYFKVAGFKTFWLSNQYYLGNNDSGYSAIAYRSDKTVYLNEISGFFLETVTYDGALLAPFKDVLNDDAKKKIIFVHLMGSHAPYSKRYPKDFGSFYPEGGYAINADKVLKGTSEAEIADAFDNSVEYTDSIVSEMISELRSTDSESYLLYFSDHGDDVNASRSESTATRQMVEIPFVLWLSDKYKDSYGTFVQGFDEMGITNRPYMTDVLAHSIIDLSRLSSADLRPEHSIFSDKFTPRIRMFKGSEYKRD